MGLKSQLGWLMRGGDRTAAALSVLAADLRALQEKVARIDDELLAQRAAGDIRLMREEIEALRDQVRTAVDDLGDRLGLLTERLNSGS
ncbi:unannotated protein [freshwater metagenome]|uniref:Unannotated protein n=1 Tax=freshwater metagenome TaxID=449393 RepID=A0A6J7EWP9_9ZZZZ|nr:hypothetical protein [Actinomycetota bacterium]